MKRFPSLSDMLGIKRKAKLQTPDEIEAGLKRMFGMKGTDAWRQQP